MPTGGITDEMFKEVLEARRKRVEEANGKSEKVSEEVKEKLIDEEAKKFAVGDKSPAWDKINLALDKVFKSILAYVSKLASKIPYFGSNLKSELSDRASAKADELKENSRSIYIKILNDEVNKSKYRELVKGYYDAGSDVEKSMKFRDKALAEWNKAVGKAREKFSEIIGESFEDWEKKCKLEEEDKD